MLYNALPSLGGLTSCSLPAIKHGMQRKIHGNTLLITTFLNFRNTKWVLKPTLFSCFLCPSLQNNSLALVLHGGLAGQDLEWRNQCKHSIIIFIDWNGMELSCDMWNKTPKYIIMWSQKPHLGWNVALCATEQDIT